MNKVSYQSKNLNLLQRELQLSITHSPHLLLSSSSLKRDFMDKNSIRHDKIKSQNSENEFDTIRKNLQNLCFCVNLADLQNVSNHISLTISNFQK